MQRHPAFRSSPTSGQYAKNGAWEQAWSFPFAALPDDASAHDYLAESAEIAFEVFFGDAFFGARFTGSPAATEDFAVNCLRALRATSRGEPFFAALRRFLSLDSLGTQVAFAEIGCVNAWRSIGAFRIANPQAALQNFDYTVANLKRQPVAQDVRHRKAIEFACESPLPHWFGIPISSPLPPHDISPALLRDALQGV